MTALALMFGILTLVILGALTLKLVQALPETSKRSRLERKYTRKHRKLEEARQIMAGLPADDYRRYTLDSYIVTKEYELERIVDQLKDMSIKELED